MVERARLPRIRFRELRHTHATQLLRAGVNPKVVQERLGHSTPAFTLAVYSHVLPGMQEEATKKLSARLFGSEEATKREPISQNGKGIAVAREAAYRSADKILGQDLASRRPACSASRLALPVFSQGIDQ